MAGKGTDTDHGHLMDAKVASIMRMSDAEIVAAGHAEGRGPEWDAQHQREIIAEFVVAAIRRRSRSER
jgi:hypothetical protein